jgi:lambda family phage portal protein
MGMRTQIHAHKDIVPVRLTILDRAMGYINPVGSLKRLRARALYNNLRNSGYITYGSAKRGMRGEFAFANSADVDTNPKLEVMRATSRDMYMNAPIATASLRRTNTSVISSGLTLQCRIDRAALQLSDEQADAWEHGTEREFALWADSRECDASRTQNFYDLQALAFFSTLLNGDCFVLLPYIPNKNLPYDLRIKLLEADYVCNPGNITDTDTMSGGVEVDSNGAPVNYHIRKNHPGGFYPTWEWTIVPAYGANSGRRNVLHLFDKERPGQRRGIPILTPVFEALKTLSKFSESELMAALVSSFFTAFITSDTPENVLGESFTEDEKVTNPDKIASDKNVLEMGNGTIVGLNSGEKIELADPKRPNGAFEPFFNAIVTQIGAAIEVPPELILLKFNSSYTAAKAAMNEAWKHFTTLRTRHERGFCKPIYEEWLTEAVAKGRRPAAGFFLDPAIRAAWCGSKWHGSGQGQLNPSVETDAAIKRINGNLSTHSKETAALDGDDWDTMIQSRAREDKLIRDKGLVPSVAGSNSNQNAPVPVQPQDKTPDEPVKDKTPDSNNEEDANA